MNGWSGGRAHRSAVTVLVAVLAAALTLTWSHNADAATRNFVDMGVTRDGQGYGLISDAGEVYAFGTVQYRGNPSGFTGTITGISVTADGQGYAATSSTGQVYAYGTVQHRAMEIRATQATCAPVSFSRPTPSSPAGSGRPAWSNCNPYSYYFGRGSTACPAGQRSEAWCADFAAYVWKQAGSNVAGITAAASSFRIWAINRGTWKSGWSNNPQIGDAIVYGGTGHVSIVVAINGPESIRVVGGNISDAVLAQWINPRTHIMNGGGVLGYAPPAN